MKRSLFAELRRRNVFRAGAFYIAAVWAFGQGLSQFSPAIGLPDWATRWFLVAAVIGFPFWIAFAWFFEFTPEGIKRERDVEPDESITPHTGRKLDFAIIGVLAIAVVLLVTDRFVLHHGVNEEAAVPVAERSLAVLPFVDMSSGKDQEYFSDGISEELLNLLAKIPQLQVTARTSSFSFKGKDTAIPEIARTLHVAHVLEGSVRKAGNSVRITAQLIRAGTDTQLWSQTYDRKLDDIFAIQDEIAADVVKQLKVTLLGAAPKATAIDPMAFALILQGRFLAAQGTPESRVQAVDLFKQALAIEPHAVRAWAALAGAYIGQANGEERPIAEGRRLAFEAVDNALASDPNDALSLSLLGWMSMNYDNDFGAAAEHLQRALALEPANPNVLGNAAMFVQNLGRLDEAISVMQYQRARDPANPRIPFNLATTFYYAGQWDKAIASAHTVLVMSPARTTIHTTMGLALLGKGDATGALAAMQAEPAEESRQGGLPIVLYALGRKAESDAALATLIAKYGNDSAYDIASVFAYRGEADQTFAWLGHAQESGQVAYIAVDPLFANLHHDARWLPFLRKVGKAPEQLAAIKIDVKLPVAPATAMTP